MALKRKHQWIIGIVLTLVLVRASLPYVGKRYINRVLASQISGYRGSIQDFDLSLFRGAYQIERLKIDKIQGGIPVPLIQIREVDFSIAWRPLFQGRVVGKVYIDRGVVNLVQGPDAQQSQYGTDGEGWQAALDKIFPLKIEELRMARSNLHFRDFHRRPKVDLHLKKMRLVATNLRNTQRRTEALTSDLNFDARIQDKGNLVVRSRLNVLEEPLAADVNLSATEIDLPRLNSFFKAYGNFDINHGRLDVFSEVATKDGLVKGYVKPLLTNVDVMSFKERIKNPGEFFSESIAATINGLIRRYSKDQMGMKIPFEGRLDNPDIEMWKTVRSAFSHAFVRALRPSVDQEVDISDTREARPRINQGSPRAR